VEASERAGLDTVLARGGGDGVGVLAGLQHDMQPGLVAE
jgi:hypothetical protein